MSLSARVPSGSDTAGFVPEIWSAKIQDVIHTALVIANTFDTQWASDLKYGDTVNVPILNAVTATEVVVGTAGTALDFATGTKKQIVVDQWYEAPIILDYMTNLQSQVNLVNKATQEAGYAIQKAIDTYCATFFAHLNGASHLNSDGDTLTDDILIQAMETLDEADCPTTDRFLIIDPSSKADMLKIDKFVRADYGSPNATANGQFGQIYGTKVLVSNNLEASSTGAVGCMYQKGAVALIVQDKPNTVIVEEPLLHRKTVLCDALWGALEMRDSFGVPFYTRKK